MPTVALTLRVMEWGVMLAKNILSAFDLSVSADMHWALIGDGESRQE